MNERSEWVKYCFCPEKIKFISSSRRVTFFLLYRQKDIDKIIEGNDQNYVIDKLKCEIMENKSLGSRMKFLWVLRVVYFPVKHSCLYNNDYINNNEIPNFFTLIVFWCERRKKNYTSSKNSERCFFMCKKNDTSNQKPQRSVSFAPKFLPFKGACSLQCPL